MSQAKVDAYKERKKNRKKIEAREKRMAWVRALIALLVVVLIGAWAGYSAYIRHLDNLPHQSAEVDYTAVNDYMTNVSTESTEEEATEEEATKEDTTEEESAEEPAAEETAEEASGE